MSNEKITDPAAQVAEGDRYYNGEGIEKDFAKAVEWYEKAALQGYAEGQYYLGYCYYEGEGVEQNFSKAAELYIKASEQGYARAQQKLAICYFMGEGVDQDIDKAFEWCKKSAEQGRAYAQYLLGYCYYNGQGTEQDLKQAVLWFEKAAVQGDADAQYYLGDCYLEGEGVEEDHEKAAFWYAKAADQNYPQAQFKLAYRYLKGDGIDCDHEKAIFWYTKSAEQGYDPAQYSLGICYKYGECTEKDLEKAFNWFEKAAEQGHADSCIELAEMYFRGEVVSKEVIDEFEKGLYWFRKAAETGTPRYMLNFGKWLLGEADGKQEKITEGLQWIEKAANENEHDDDEMLWQAKWTLAEIFEHGLHNIKKDLKKAISYYEQLVESGDDSASVYVKLLNRGKEDPINSRGWENKHLVVRTIAEYFPDFDIAGSLYETEEDYQDVKFTKTEKEAVLPIAEKILALSDLVKRESILALAQEAEKEKDVYFKTALKLAAEGIKAELFYEVIKVLFIKERPAGAQLLSRFIIQRGIYLIIRGDFTTDKLRVLLGSCYVPLLLASKPQSERKYKTSFNYLLTHHEIPRLIFEDLNMFYNKVLPDPDMMQRFLTFAHGRAKFIAAENSDIEPAYEIENFEMYIYEESKGRSVIVITFPKCENPPDSYQIAIPTARQMAGYYACELSFDFETNEPCFIFGEWTKEMKHQNYGKIDMANDNAFAKKAVEIAYGKPLDKLPFDRSKMKFDTPTLELYCEDCGTTNFFYSDNKPPYLCDSCGAELNEDE